MNSKFSIPRFFLELGLILLGVFGSILCLTSAFLLPLPEEFWMIVVFLAVFNCILFNRKKLGHYCALCLLFLLLMMLYLSWDVIVESFRNLWGELFQRFASGYDLLRNYLPEEPTDPHATGAALIALSIVQTYVVSLSVRQWRMVLPAALVLLLGVLPCFILTDTPPDLLPLMMVVFSLLTQAFSQSVRRRDLGEVVKSLCLSALLSAAILGGLLLCFPQETYEPPVSWESLSTWMSNMSNRRNNQGNLDAGLTGNPSTIELNELGALPNHPFTCLYARSSLAGAHYLRGTVYTGFDGSVWSRGEPGTWSEADLFPYLDKDPDFWRYKTARDHDDSSLMTASPAPLGLSNVMKTAAHVEMDGSTDVAMDVSYPINVSAGYLQIETVGIEPMLFTTYQNTSLPQGAVVGDDYVRNAEELQVYSMNYLTNPPSLTDPGQSSSPYEEWVLQNCLFVPEETRAGVLSWWETHGQDVRPLASDLGAVVEIDSESGLLRNYESDTVRFAEEVAARVSTCATYSRNPAHVPQGKDFCTWFLNEASSGYCVHFASSCVALLRSLGVPARYVSGYVCTLVANKNSPVSNLQAHAWVEIWSGGRWLCIEPTPSDATEFTGRIFFGNVTPEEESLVPPVTEPLPTRVPVVTQPPAESTTEARPSESEKKPVDLTPLWVFLGLVGLVALFPIRRTLRLRRWHRRLRRVDSNERTKLMYRRMQRLSRVSGARIPDNVVALANKAAFSQHEISLPELEELRLALKYQSSRASIAGFWKKLYAKYLLAIL